ncbi:restriction endonuclease subunit S [Providencia rettgeri]|uniref:restriction endonuclease subunit S n=1 Tax=Providencia rettgeri TaxID=587 RepID=UPI00101307C0|nr:restriction endonuclease subunit S [Providencia rettgeri]RXN73422.1 restriction endonuclease subunit S [Providencia rettgeri]
MAGRYKAYPEYKDSGIDWIKDIPLNWMVISLRHLISSIKNGSTETQIEKSAESVAISRIETISTGDLNMDKTGFVNPKFISESFKLKTGDLLLSHINSLSMVGNVAQVQAKHFIYHGMNLLRLVPKEGVLSRYLYWQLKSDYSRRLIESVAKPAINQASVSTESLKTLQMLCPSLVEQQKIANFLDHETAKIDTLIAKQEKLIELIQEKRQAVISNAVTKGLNPDVPMKDSGVEWLGEVPEHWDRSRLGFECSVKARLGWKGLKADEYVPEGYIFLATPNIKGSDIDFENVNYITKQRYDESPEIMLQENDLLVTKDGSTTGTTNLVRSLPEPATVNSSIAVIRSRGNIHPEYLYYFFVSTYTQNVIKRMQGGMGVPHLFQADLRWFHILLPSNIEQKSIAKYLDIQTAKCDLIIKKATNAIQLMKERKTALILAAVTGKIDVRDWQPKGIQ